MEINERMSKRFAWLLGAVVLVAIGFLLACGSTYNSSSNGLVLIGSQGSALMETFGFSLASGTISEILNPPSTTSTLTCVLNGQPSSIVIDPKGAYAYAIINAVSTCPGSSNGIESFRINSSGTLTASGTVVPFNQGTIGVPGTIPPTETVSVVPYTMVMDVAGKFLFVADRTTTDSSGRYIPGSVSAFAISSGTVTEVAGSPFYPTVPAINTIQQSYDIIAVAPTPTLFPPVGVSGSQNSPCSTPDNPPPTTQYLYAADSLGNQVFEFQVNMSTGVLGYPGGATAPLVFAAGQLPSGVVVDPCNRFVYVTDQQQNKVSGYTICNGSPTQSSTCAATDGRLVGIAGSPFSNAGSANTPGPIIVDPFGNYVYALGYSGGISTFKISPISGQLQANATVTATGLNPTAIAIRADDNWLFVANYGSATLSQYTVTPATGILSPLPATTTDNLPWGIAVK